MINLSNENSRYALEPSKALAKSSYLFASRVPDIALKTPPIKTSNLSFLKSFAF